MPQLHLETWLRVVIWLVIGLVIYISYDRKHSPMNTNSPRPDEHVVLPHAETRKSAAIETAVYVVKAKVTVPDTER